MAADADIGNLALSHLGENGTIVTIDPPEGSVQAVHIARFYPIARDALQEAYPWKFCTRRTTPAMLTSESSSYTYAYQLPNNALHIFSVLPPDATDDYTSTFNETVLAAPVPELATQYGSGIVPQNFSMETLEDGQQVIYTDVKSAVIRYGIRETDAAKFSPLFVTGLSRLLASFAAGPIIKGRQGRQEAKFQYEMFRAEIGLAQVSDANQTKNYMNHSPIWMSNR